MKIDAYNDDLPFVVNSGTIAIDCEAMGLNIKRDRLCLTQISDEQGNVSLVKFSDNYNAPNLKAILENPEVEKIFHFARFDVAILNHYLSTNVSNVYCTKIASKIARTYSQKHGLKFIVRELLGAELNKYEQSSYWGSEQLSKSQEKYAAHDVLYLHELKQKLDEILIKENRMHLARNAMQMLSSVVELDLNDFNCEEILQH